MKPSNTHDELFDVILKKAFTESSEKEIAEYEKEAEQYADITPTEKQRKQARRAYRAAHPKKSADGRIAASVVLALCLGAAAILSIPSARAKMSDSFIQIYDTHITYKKTNPAVLRDITVQFIPKGYFYKPSDAPETPGIRKYDFINANKQRISLMCASSENPPMIGLDNEFHTRKEVHIPGAVNAFAMVPENVEDYTFICWETENHIFLLDGQLPLAELVRMARSIIENEPPAESQNP